MSSRHTSRCSKGGDRRTRHLGEHPESSWRWWSGEWGPGSTAMRCPYRPHVSREALTAFRLCSTLETGNLQQHEEGRTHWEDVYNKIMHRNFCFWTWYHGNTMVYVKGVSSPPKNSDDIRWYPYKKGFMYHGFYMVNHGIFKNTKVLP